MNLYKIFFKVKSGAQNLTVSQLLNNTGMFSSINAKCHYQ